MIHIIKNLFSTGILFLLPFITTFWIIKSLIKTIGSLLEPIAEYVPPFMSNIPHPEFVLAVLVILITGYIINTFFLGRIIESFETSLVKKIPLVRQIYFSIKNILVVVNKTDNKDAPEQVAWVRLPHRGVHCLGFMTGELDPSISPDTEEKYYSFFIPTTPNPVSGYYIAVQKSQCSFVNISREEAISMIISGGVVKPEKKHSPVQE